MAVRAPESTKRRTPLNRERVLSAALALADQGGFELSSLPCLRAWLARVEAQPGYVRMLPRHAGT